MMNMLRLNLSVLLVVALLSYAETKEEEANYVEGVEGTNEDYWFTYTTYSSTSCSGTALYGTAYKMYTCIKRGASSSVYYTVVNNLVQVRDFYSSSTCTGTYYGNSIDKCDYGTKGQMITGQPTWTGPGSIQSDSCGGSPIVIDISSFLDTCSYGTKYVYNKGADVCLRQVYLSDSCVGTPTSVRAVLNEECSLTDTYTYGCVIDNALLSPKNIAPTMLPSVVVEKTYAKNKCEGNPMITTYSAIASCDGDGTKATVSDASIIYSKYDKYDCTGTLYDTDNEILSSCTNTTLSSYSTSIGTYPSASSLVGFTATYVDSCSSPTTTYLMSTYSPTCINNTFSFSSRLSSYNIICSSNSTNITLTRFSYDNDVCSSANNATVSNVTSVYPLCSENDDFELSRAVKYSCVQRAYSAGNQEVVSWVVSCIVGLLIGSYIL